MIRAVMSYSSARKLRAERVAGKLAMHLGQKDDSLISDFTKMSPRPFSQSVGVGSLAHNPVGGGCFYITFLVYLSLFGGRDCDVCVGNAAKKRRWRLCSITVPRFHHLLRTVIAGIRIYACRQCAGSFISRKKKKIRSPDCSVRSRLGHILVLCP